ncbi:hypothetical protein Taitung16_02070 [Helicobacter pylori]
MVDTNFMDLHTSGTSGIKAIFENEVIFNNPKNDPYFKIKVVLKFYGDRDDVGDGYRDYWIQKGKLNDFFLTLKD